MSKKKYSKVNVLIKNKRDEDLISEKELMEMVRSAQKEYLSGKVIRVKSIKELL